MNATCYRIEKLAAAIGDQGTTAYSNAAIVDLGDRTIAVDAFMMPQPGASLARTAEDLTGRKAAIVFLTHYHQDHWGGASSFPDALFAASANARRVMLEDKAEYEEWKNDTSELEAGIETTKASLQGELPPDERARLEERLRRDQGILHELPTLICRIPDVTIDSRLALHGSRRVAEARVFECGHTESDLYIELPEDGVVFCGDLAFFGCQPFMYDASPGPWIEWIKKMEASPCEVFVPGHGPVGGKRELGLLRQFIETLSDLVRAAVRRGDPVDRALEIRLPEPFAAWQADSVTRFQVNVRALCERFADDKG